MKKLIYFGMGLLLCLSATLWTGCKDKEEEPGAVYGVVADKATGSPIKTAGVELQPIGLKTVTGTDGQYRFDELEPGTYKLYVTKTGYVDLLSNEIVVKSGQTARCDVQLAQALRIINYKAEDIDELDFGADEDDVQRSFNIFNDSKQTLQWKIIAPADWIMKVSMENGTLSAGQSQNITITINRWKLKVGDNVTTLYITSNEGRCQLQLKAQADQRLPIVNTLEVMEIGDTTARLYGKITDVGKPAYTERGFVYS
ncbi:MAG: carboxypeptidase regulatory-like domain-containing protein, partial [Bacteroidales bacterium]|nr:carboxypeptidase regulatory-like domain-containing protein [Bacteroidales bacterium]